MSDVTSTSPTEQFSQKLADLLHESLKTLPINVVLKVVSNHQIDLQCVYAQALTQNAVQEMQKAHAEPAS